MPSQFIDQDALFASAVREGQDAFSKIVALYPHDTFYVFGFYTDSDLSSIYPFAHTLEEFGFLGENDLYTKWSPDEWKVDFIDEEWMEQSSEMLNNAAENYDENDSEEEILLRKQATLQTLTRALLSIRDSRIFGRVDQVACFVLISDASEEEAQMMLEPVMKHLMPETRAELRMAFEI